MFNARRVIVIEDDRDINDLIAYNLRKEGFCVEQFFDGTSGLQRLKSQSSGIVILDIMLPGIDGFDICQQIKGDTGDPFTFIIVVSAKSHEQDKLYAHLLGADCYLTKPFNLASLMGAVKEVSANSGREFSVKLN
jgi:DNA-binding response OmpR family regulator